MIVFELNGNNESHSVYNQLQISNNDRQYSFLESVVEASLQFGRPFFSHQVIKALNYHAICCLHVSAGEYRGVPVVVGAHNPPREWQVQPLMDDFVDTINLNWHHTETIVLAAMALWRLNWIHPFINGNGRTARALCYYVVCVKAGRLLPGTPTLPEALVIHHDRYVEALRLVDQSAEAGALNLGPLVTLLDELLVAQLSSVLPSPPSQDPGAAADQPPPNPSPEPQSPT